MSHEQHEPQPGDRDDFERLRPASGEAADLGRAARRAERIEEGAVELRPRGIGEVLDLGLDLVRSRFGLCVALAVVVWIPLRWLTILVPMPEVPAGGIATSELIRFLASAMWANLTALTGEMLVVGIVARILGDQLEGRRTGAGRALQATVSRLPGLMVIVFVTNGLLVFSWTLIVAVGLTRPDVTVLMTVFFGACVLFLPAVFLLWIMNPAPYAYVIEGVGLLTAMRRSVRLSSGKVFSKSSFFSFWRWVGLSLVGFVLLVPISALVAVPEEHRTRAWLTENMHLSTTALDTLRVLVGGLFLAVSSTARSGFYTAWYLDCRVRREGLDLEMWLRRIRADEAGGAEKQGAAEEGARA